MSPNTKDEDYALENYLVLFGTFGPFSNGEVIPRFWLDAKGHNVDELIERKVIRRTMDQVNCSAKILADQPKLAPNPAPALQAEIEKLSKELETTRSAHNFAVGRAESAERESKAKDKGIGDQLAEIGRLKGIVESQKAELAKAKSDLDKAHADLDAATKPATPPAPNAPTTPARSAG